MKFASHSHARSFRKYDKKVALHVLAEARKVSLVCFHRRCMPSNINAECPAVLKHYIHSCDKASKRTTMQSISFNAIANSVACLARVSLSIRMRGKGMEAIKKQMSVTWQFNLVCRTHNKKKVDIISTNKEWKFIFLDIYSENFGYFQILIFNTGTYN